MSAQPVRTVTTWKIDPAHTTVEFAVRHMMITWVKGRFGKVEGSVTGDLSDPTTAQVEVTIDAASIDTREEQRDAHLRSADFFDVEKYPSLHFKSTRIERVGPDQYRVSGDLTMHGVTRQVTLATTFDGQGKDPWGNQRAAFSARTEVNRKDFGLHWNAALEAGGVLVGDQVKIEIHSELIQQQ